MDKLVPELYKSFGLYTNSEKMLPNNIDGLLPVYRRLLLGAHLICRKKQIKTSKLLGEVMARWHPHAEAITPATWLVQNGFLDGGGQWGNRVGTTIDNPASPRYTKVKANEYIEKIAFEYIDSRSVKWEELESDLEPIVIPTMFPLCFLFKFEMNSMAFGYKTVIPTFTIKSLRNRLFHLLNSGDVTKNLIIPNIEGCEIEKDKQETINLLTKGKGTLNVSGKYSIDEKDYCVYIHGWPPRTTFENILNKIDKYENSNLLSNEDIGYIDLSSESQVNVQFHILKLRNKSEIFDKMRQIIPECIKGKVNYEIVTTTTDGETIKTSVDNMLLNAYYYFKSAYEESLKYQIESNNYKLSEIEVIEAISPFISGVINKFNDYASMIKDLSSKTKIEEDRIKRVVEKYRIKKILSYSSDKEKENLNKHNKELSNKLNNIDESIENEYKEV